MDPRTFPTKGNLILAKNSLALANQGYELMDKKRNILIRELMELIDQKLDKGTRRVTLHLPYDKTGLLDGIYREGKVESVEYGATVDVVAICTPRLLGQLKDYIEGWTEEKEEWEM